MVDLPLSCQCGAVHGTVSAAGGVNRLTCYCADCRAFARFGVEGGGRDVADASGGTDLFQTTAGRVRLEGAEYLAAIRVTARGPVRWYCARCRTPLANTLSSPALPFATLAVANLGGDRAALPPTQGAFFTDTAPDPPLHKPVGRLAMMGVMARFAHAMLGARRRGEHRSSPFHANGRPIAEPRRMEPAERERLASAAPPARP